MALLSCRSGSTRKIDAVSTTGDLPNDPSMKKLGAHKALPYNYIELALNEKCFRIFDEVFDFHEEAHSGTTIDNAVIVSECHVHPGTNHDFSVDDNGTVFNAV